MSRKSKSEQDRDLAESLEETFPASDASSSNEPDADPIRPAHRKPPLLDPKLVEALAEQVDELRGPQPPRRTKKNG